MEIFYYTVDMKFRIALLLVLVYVIEVSLRRIESAAEIFDRERYERSRNRPKGKPFNPVANDEKALDFVALVNAFGYPAEEYTVKTIDGYKIRIHRIPGSPSNLGTRGKPVVFMQHGLLASSDSWVLMGPTHDLAYMLADVGFDVWLGNTRGNTYSRKHVSLSPDYDEDFWRYSFHEIALYDITTAIDYILQLTNQRQIIYIGHSMGTTISYVLLSEKPEYNDKIKLVISLAPAAIWHNRSNEITNFLLDHADKIRDIIKKGKIYELLPLTNSLVEFGRKICGNSSPYQKLCLKLQSLFVGDNLEQTNTSLVAHTLQYLPAGISAHTVDHYSQVVQSGHFKMFDYGIVENFKIYKQIHPPLYNLSNIVAPIAILYGNGDTLIPAENAVQLSKMLPNVLTIETVPDGKFNHLDFLFARDLKILLNDRLVEIIAQLTQPRKTGSLS
ncbi:lipase 3 isoform X2 [Nasonia vitripennis]|uniref:Lipase n=1 Tax=Nasonia vitripennis TaxID=7425 RepID=A0A7M7QWZ6_NASVI|nr:lipase 3 isoform X2 [Nasonia vitripennis]